MSTAPAILDRIQPSDLVNMEGSTLTIRESFNHGTCLSELTIFGTPEQPLFQLSEVENVLGMTNLRSTVESYGDDEKVVRMVCSPTVTYLVTFLTEEGIITLMDDLRHSPVAKTFRRWVTNVAKRIMTEDAEQKARAAEAALKREQEVNENLKRQLGKKHEAGETVYIVRNPSDAQRSLYKIGKSKDLKKRTQQYNTAMPDGSETVHCVRTCDAHLVERIVHHILDDYRYNPNREWFQGNAELFARVVNAAARFVDGLTASVEKAEAFKIDEEMTNLMERLHLHDLSVPIPSLTLPGECTTRSVSNDSNHAGPTATAPSDDCELVDRFISQRVIKVPTALLNWSHIYKAFRRWCDIKGLPERSSRREYEALFQEKLGNFNGVETKSWRGWNLDQVGLLLKRTQLCKRDQKVLDQWKETF